MDVAFRDEERDLMDSVHPNQYQFIWITWVIQKK